MIEFFDRYSSLSASPHNARKGVVVSFFGGDNYYASCAERLVSQCESYGVDYSIAELKLDSGWRNICRKKIQFYASMLLKLERPILWVDVDTKLIGDPSPLLASSADFGAFLRNFKYLVGFDPLAFSRLFHPGYVYLNNSPCGLEFASHLIQTDEVADHTGTDDYVLQEALATFGRKLQIEVFSPRYVVSSNESEGREDACFQHSDSGNVAASASAAAQHQSEGLSVSRQKQVLYAAADDAAKNGRLSDVAVFIRRVRAIDRNDPVAVRRILQVYDRLGEMSKYRYHYNEAKKNPLTRSAAQITELARRLVKKDYAKADEIASDIRRQGEASDVKRVKSMMFRASLDRRAGERRIEDKDRVAAWWWEQPYPGNLGDIINPYVIEALSGVPPVFSTKSPRMLAIGSIIKFAKGGDKVWGAGAPSKDTPINPNASYFAVRGPLTRQAVLRAGGQCQEVYGDPAWFLPLIYSPTVRKTHRLGVIRHFTHRSSPLILGEGVKEIEIIRSGYDEIESFIDEVLSCDAIVSTSLHGIIIANAYGVPCKYAVMSASSRQIHGDGIKFEDYFMSIGRTGVQPWDISGVEQIVASDAERCSDNPEHPIDLKALANAAPFELAPSILKKINRGGSLISRMLGGLGL